MEAMLDHPSLKEVNMSDNVLGAESCERMAETLASPKVLLLPRRHHPPPGTALSPTYLSAGRLCLSQGAF